MVARFAGAVIPLGEIALVKRIRNAPFCFIPPRKRPIPRRSSVIDTRCPVFYSAVLLPFVVDKDQLWILLESDNVPINVPINIQIVVEFWRKYET